ncbi:hypothetical protein O181_005206 [Austropuccinia psidii MF-1]|uniref:Uncharacterized protein n=1 Tax=Austropuccinia psidii MF-1 TaxID=1389203 RepID=A0A9Q3GFP7_9BASI|nr:hypothetical protein [Austropuccinia psidii MF-1]
MLIGVRSRERVATKPSRPEQLRYYRRDVPRNAGPRASEIPTLPPGFWVKYGPGTSGGILVIIFTREMATYDEKPNNEENTKKKTQYKLKKEKDKSKKQPMMRVYVWKCNFPKFHTCNFLTHMLASESP